MKYQYITIEGNIGSGKTTLCNILATQFNTTLVLEQFSDNPFLPKFYENPEKYGFQLELSFLAERFKQLKEMLNTKNMFSEITITDYLFIKCKLFARVNLAPDEYNLFTTLFDIIYPNLPLPQLLIYLHCPIEQLQKNIKTRARDYEQTIPDQYLQNLQDAYWQLMKNINIPVLIIDTSKVDFVGKTEDLEFIKNLLNQDWTEGIHYV
jgi:deoxyadenosine/deoxycytidine kinase